MRIVGRDRTNLRVNVDTGDVTEDEHIIFAQPNPFGGVAPAVVGVAYSNSVATAQGTLLWDVEGTTDALYLQLPPNDGVITAVANPLGIVVNVVGFDIETTPDGVNRAWLINGNVLYQLGLVSGIAMNGTAVTDLAGPVRDLAVLPATQ